MKLARKSPIPFCTGVSAGLMTSRILIIDDIAANARLLAAVLEAEYYVTRTSFSGIDAIEMAAAWRPDLVLLDVMMPELDGYEVCRRLKGRTETTHIPILLVTALSGTIDRIRGLECGADDFFSKPVEREVLLARISGLVRLKRLLDEWGRRREAAHSLGLMDDAPPQLLMGLKTVLVIDDQDQHTSHMQRILARDCISIKRAGTADAALEAVKTGSFDLSIINLGMRAENPLRIIANLRAAKAAQEMPLLLIAEPDQHRLRTRGFELGANDCIRFPVDELELRLRVRNQIRLKRYWDQLRSDVGDVLKLGAVDDLTGLYNKRFFRHRLTELSANEYSSLSILMIDVDKFKTINDSYGHRAGDQVLQAISSHLRSGVREYDLVARYGGEEFAVIMPRSDRQEASFVAERIRATVERASFNISAGQPLQITVSVGVGIAATGTADVDALIERADRALYEAKNSGRNRIALG
jgi:two-component system cell cycle response regulator